MAVLDAFKGIDAQTVDVVTGQGGGDCGYDFKVNESYLIYAWEDKGVLSTGICSRTRLMSEASEDLEYIRGLPKASPNGRISGSIFISTPRRSDDMWQPNPTIPGLEIAASGPKGVVSVQTDGEGKFAFENTAPGDYILRAVAPKGLYPDMVEQKVKLVGKGCAVTSLVFVPQTAVKGRLLDERGDPAGDIGVNLIPVEYINEKYQKDTYYSHTDSGGNFAFLGIPPGNYYLGVRLSRITDIKFKYPRSFYPGTQKLDSAAVLVVAEGQILENHNFQLPFPLSERVIEGVITWPDGKPAVGAYVATEEIEYASGSMGFSDGITDSKGRFSIKRMDGLKYLLRVHVNLPDGQQRHPEPVAIPKTGSVKDIKLVISEAGGSCLKCRGR
jgi:hypothetical protein